VRQAIGEDRFGHRFVKGTKSNRQRTVPLNTLAIAALRRHRANQVEEKMLHRDVYDDQDFVFANELGAMLDLDSVSKAFSALATEVGIKVKGISLHSCRHFGATQALVSGNDLRTVAALLGHADASVTLRTYAHVVPGAQERAVARIGDPIAAAHKHGARQARTLARERRRKTMKGCTTAPKLHRERQSKVLEGRLRRRKPA
jgi:integrase